jgi:hypothetical protein
MLLLTLFSTLAHNRVATTHLCDRLAPMVQIGTNAQTGVGARASA